MLIGKYLVYIISINVNVIVIIIQLFPISNKGLLWKLNRNTNCCQNNVWDISCLHPLEGVILASLQLTRYIHSIWNIYYGFFMNECVPVSVVIFWMLNNRLVKLKKNKKRRMQLAPWNKSSFMSNTAAQTMIYLIRFGKYKYKQLRTLYTCRCLLQLMV